MAASMAAKPDFMSAEPLPYILPPLMFASYGGDDQADASFTGTTSM
jgi:hypothetical protein